MRTSIVLAIAASLTAAGLATFARQETPQAVPRYESPGKLTVHEWGTFTNFSGSDGVEMEFRPLATSDLPAFVFDRARQANRFFPTVYSKGFYLARQRMETPVIYFYTDRPRDMDVAVGFQAGLLTEFYPPVDQMAPAYNPFQPERLGESYLRWRNVRLIPQTGLAAAQQAAGAKVTVTPPTVEGGDHYAYARETDSALVETTGSAGRHYEKFLFYRGIGNFSLPLKLEAQGTGRFRLTNAGTDAVEGLFLVSIDGVTIDGPRVRFAEQGRLGGQTTVTLLEPSQESTVDALANAVAAALTRAGLYEKEARSMVRTWRSSWFGEPGTRLLYLVPPRLTDEVLPLTIDPKPDELVRVLVGRMEIMTPEQERQFARLLAGVSADDFIKDEAIVKQLENLGRFAEPALRRIARTNGDPAVRQRAEQLLAEEVKQATAQD